jgi:hypothetical protein
MVITVTEVARIKLFTNDCKKFTPPAGLKTSPALVVYEKPSTFTNEVIVGLLGKKWGGKALISAGR